MCEEPIEPSPKSDTSTLTRELSQQQPLTTHLTLESLTSAKWHQSFPVSATQQPGNQCLAERFIHVCPATRPRYYFGLPPAP